MKVINLGESNTILNKFVAHMRDHKIQKDSMRFRRNLERVGEVFAYEISKTLDSSVKPVTTPLGIAQMETYDDQIVISTILRAGLPLHDGILQYFDDAQNAFVAAYRKYHKGEEFNINSPKQLGLVLFEDLKLPKGKKTKNGYSTEGVR